MYPDNETRFLNVDLEVSSASELGWLVEEFGEDVTNLYCGAAQATSSNVCRVSDGEGGTKRS